MADIDYRHFIKEYLAISLSLHETPYEAMLKAGIKYPDYVYFLALDESKGILPTEPVVLPEDCEVSYILDMLPTVEAFGCIVVSDCTLLVGGTTKNGLLSYYRGVGKSLGAFRTYEIGKLSSSIIWIFEDTIGSQNDDELEWIDEGTYVVGSTGEGREPRT